MNHWKLIATSRSSNRWTCDNVLRKMKGTCYRHALCDKAHSCLFTQRIHTTLKRHSLIFFTTYSFRILPILWSMSQLSVDHLTFRVKTSFQCLSMASILTDINSAIYMHKTNCLQKSTFSALWWFLSFAMFFDTDKDKYCVPKCFPDANSNMGSVRSSPSSAPRGAARIITRILCFES